MNISLRSLALGLIAGLAGGFGVSQLLQPSSFTGTSAPIVASNRGLPSIGHIGDGPTGPDDLDRLADPNPVREVAPTGSASPAPVSNGALQRAMESVQVVEAHSGTGWLEVLVVDTQGQPLGEVELRLKPRLSGISQHNALGAAAPKRESLDTELRLAAERIALNRSRLRVGITGPLGLHRFEGLPDGSWSIGAYLEGYEIDTNRRNSSRARTNSRIQFDAEQTHGLIITVTDVDGAPVQKALISVADEGSDNYTQEFAWTGGQPLRLTEGAYSLRALSMEGLDSREAFRFARFASDPVVLEVRMDAAAPPLNLHLKQRRGVYGRILTADGSPAPNFPRVLKMPLPTGQEPDVALLKNTQATGSSNWDGTYTLLDMDPGTYMLGLQVEWNDPPILAATVEIGELAFEQDLLLPAPDANDTLIIRMFDPKGRLVNGDAFQLKTRQGQSSSSSGIRPERKSLGVYHYRKPQTLLGVPVQDETCTISARHSRYGSAKVEFDKAQTEVELHFQEPATLEVFVAGYVGSGYEGRLALSVTPEGDSSQSYFYSGPNSNGQLDASGQQDFKGLSVGAYTVHLSMHSRSNATFATRVSTLATLPVTLKAGENRAQIAIPTLYSIAIYAPGAKEGTNASAYPDRGKHRTVGPDSELLHTHSVPLDSGGRATLEDVYPGNYSILVKNFKRQVIQVPGGEVIMEPDEPRTPKDG